MEILQPILIEKRLGEEETKQLLSNALNSIVKVVVDARKGILSMAGELHIDCADQLLKSGSLPADLWGANIYWTEKKIDFVSLINIKPNENRSMEIQNPEIRERVGNIIKNFLF